jgi:outer membrane receptor protein involved in Fe transport
MGLAALALSAGSKLDSTMERRLPRGLRDVWLIMALAALFWAIALGFASAQEDASASKKGQASRIFTMDEVVVTASRTEEEIREVPRNVTVVTAEDIAQATSNYVPNLLARETGIVLKSFYGTDKNAGIDIRGMGETSNSNVIVMVDGFRLNPPDMAGPDFSTIPIDEIERIEIVRGANSVLYGSGAVGGVVNIITKRGAGKPYGNVYGSYGSYSTVDGRVSGGGTFGDLNLSLNADYFDTDGYRDNGDLKKKDAGLRARYDMTDYLNKDIFKGVLLSLSGGYHEDSQGFPGGVPIEDIDSRSRRKTTASPKDGADTNDGRLRGGVEADFGKAGVLRINAGLRDRSSDYIFGYTPLKSKSDQTSTLDEDTYHADVGHVLDYHLGAMANTLQVGAEAYSTDYITERLDQRERKNSDTGSYGIFATHRARFGELMNVDLGARYNVFRGAFRNDTLTDFGGDDRWVNGEKFHRNFDNQAYQAGLVLTPVESTSLFANFATSFRIPNVDEYALAADDLKPQEGWHVDVGWRQRYRKWAESTVTLFYFEIDDEIYYDPNLRLNRNYDDTTQRTGVELAAKLNVLEPVFLWGNFTYTWARFKDTDHDIPLVPNYSANFGLEWRVFEPLSVAVLGTFVGEKYDGSDIDNETFAKIDAYQVFDLKVTYTWKSLKVFGGINNIFDDLYSTVAFSESYYTMPTRNFYAGAQFSF